MHRPLRVALALAGSLLLAASLAACAGRRLTGASGSSSAPVAPPAAYVARPAPAPARVPVAAVPRVVRLANGFDARDVPLQDALAEARRQGKPVALFFTATWCGWCRKLESETLPDATVREELAYWYTVRYDADGPVGSALVPTYAAHGFPTVALLDGNGRPIGDASGYSEPARFVSKMQSGRR